MLKENTNIQVDMQIDPSYQTILREFICAELHLIVFEFSSFEY